MNTKSPQITIVFNRRKTASPTTKASVEIRITHNYKQKYIATGIKLYSTQWKNGSITNCPDILQISQTLNKIVSNIRQIIIDMMDEGHIDIMSISHRLEAKENNKTDFITFCVQRAKVRQYGKKKDTQERYSRFLRLFKEWGGIKNFDDINEKTIINYDQFLATKGMKPYSKWNNYHRFLNSFIIDAFDAGYIRKNPYKWVNIEKDKNTSGIEKFLTLIEFNKLKNTNMPTVSLEKVKDLFIFQTYTCLSYTDLKDFDFTQIKQIKDMKVYTGKRHKTGKPFTIPILNSAYSILMKYKGTLPIISNVKYNLYLKTVAQTAGIDKPLTSHWARHTGATLLLNEGVDINIVAKICGHSSIRVTEQIYAKLLDETVVNAIQDIII